jgi:hypothetical protein
METDILAIASRIRLMAKKVGGNQHMARQTGIPLGTLNNYIAGSNRVPFFVAFAIAKAANVSLHWLATGEETSTLPAIDLDQLTNSVIDACYDDLRPGYEGHWEQVFDVLKVALGQPDALAPMFRPVAADQHAVANTENRAAVTPQATAARNSPLCFRDFLVCCVSGLMTNSTVTIGEAVDHLLAEMGRLGFGVVKDQTSDDIVAAVNQTKHGTPTVFEKLNAAQQQVLIVAVHELAIGSDDADEQIGPFVRGFFHAALRR